MYKGLIAVSLLIVSSVSLTGTAFAGKRERDMMTNKLTPAVKDAAAKFQASCGCALTITVDETSIKTVDDMQQASYMAGKVSDGSKKYCTDDASKKAVCQLTGLTLAKVEKPAKVAFTFKDGKGVMTTDGQANCTFEMITHVLDK